MLPESVGSVGNSPPATGNILIIHKPFNQEIKKKKTTRMIENSIQAPESGGFRVGVLAESSPLGPKKTFLNCGKSDTKNLRDAIGFYEMQIY